MADDDIVLGRLSNASDDASFYTANQDLEDVSLDDTMGGDDAFDNVDTSTESKPVVEVTIIDAAGIDDASNKESADDTNRIGMNGGRSGMRAKTTDRPTTSAATSTPSSATASSMKTSVTTGANNKDTDDRTTTIDIKENTTTLVVPVETVPVTTNTESKLRNDDDITPPTKRPKLASVRAGLEGSDDGKIKSSPVPQPSSSSVRSIVTVAASTNTNIEADRTLDESRIRYGYSDSLQKHRANSSPLSFKKRWEYRDSSPGQRVESLSASMATTVPPPLVRPSQQNPSSSFTTATQNKKRKATTKPDKKAESPLPNKKFKTSATPTQGEDGKKKLKSTTQTTATTTDAVATTFATNLTNSTYLRRKVLSTKVHAKYFK